LDILSAYRELGSYRAAVQPTALPTSLSTTSSPPRQAPRLARSLDDGDVGEIAADIEPDVTHHSLPLSDTSSGDTTPMDPRSGMAHPVKSQGRPDRLSDSNVPYGAGLPVDGVPSSPSSGEPTVLLAGRMTPS
jgi:hypothetical protein